MHKKHVEPEYHEAGIYMMRHKKSGDFYIGASCDLTSRINSHIGAIRRKAYSGGKRLRAAYSKWKLTDVEFRVIERVQVPTSEAPRPHWTETCPPGIAQLRDRERYWINTLKPTLNSMPRTKLRLDQIPVGLPEDLKQKLSVVT